MDVARALVGVAMRAGAKAPDLSSAEAFKKAMLAAKSVSYVDPKAGGALGSSIAGLFEKMGIAAEMQKKTIFPNQASEVADAVAKGHAELGITFTSEMITNKGVKLAGLLPDAIQLPTIYVAAIPVGVPHPDAARAFLQAIGGSARSRCNQGCRAGTHTGKMSNTVWVSRNGSLLLAECLYAASACET